MRTLFAIALTTALIGGTAAAEAQGWPSRPVTLVVPFTAGTTSDVLARGLTDHLAKAIGQPVVVENRGGAGGNIGAGVVAKAQPDGHTILFATTGPGATNRLMYKNLPFDPQKDFTPVVLVGKSPVIVVARPDAPVKGVAELIAYAKVNPDKLTAGFPGNGTLGHVTGLLLMQRAGITIGQLQYRGSAAIMTDLIGGHIDLAMDSMAAYVPNIKEGKLKALAIAGTARWADLPDVPTVSESGLPGFDASVWYALVAPTGTPPVVVAKLNAATNDFLATPEAKAMFAKLGVHAAGGSPADLAAFVTAELAKWGPIIQAAKIEF